MATTWFTDIYFTRHEEHDKEEKIERLLPDAEKRAQERGRILMCRGTRFHHVVTSPRPRAVRTADAMLLGNQSAPDFAVDRRIGDFKTDPRVRRDQLESWKRKAQETYGDDSDSNMARVIRDMPEMHDLLSIRAEEGALALTEIAKTAPDEPARGGKSVLVTSHGLARMELTLRWLHGFRGADLLRIDDDLIERGEVVLVRFTTEDLVTTLHKIEPLQLLSAN